MSLFWIMAYTISGLYRYVWECKVREIIMYLLRSGVSVDKCTLLI